VVLGHLGAAYARAGNAAGTQAVLDRLTAMTARAYVPSSAFAVVHAARGATADALVALERAYDEHDFAITQIRVAPWYEGLRTEPRFERILQRLGLPR
jgi:hypothetical protein